MDNICYRYFYVYIHMYNIKEVFNNTVFNVFFP